MGIGQKVVRTPVSFADRESGSGKTQRRPMTGTVVYIHPKGRYHVVEFQLPGGKIRESFAGVRDG